MQKIFDELNRHVKTLAIRIYICYHICARFNKVRLEEWVKAHSFQFCLEANEWLRRMITEIIEEISAEFLAQNGLELYNSEFVKEGRDWFLRVYIDKTQEAQYVSTDDCEKVSRFLSAELDRIDPIEQNYYLEVSSPGMDRALLKDKDFVRFAGEIVDISLYKAVDGQKAYQGRLVGIEDGKIITRMNKITELNSQESRLQRRNLP